MPKENRGVGMGVAVAVMFLVVGAYLASASYWSMQSNSALPAVAMVAGDEYEGSESSSADEKSEESEDQKSEDEDEKSEPEDEVSEVSEPSEPSQARTTTTTTTRAPRTTQEVSEPSEAGETEMDDEKSEAMTTELSESSEWSLTKTSDAMYQDANKTVTKLRKEAGEARKHIIEKSKENVNIAPAIAALTVAEGKINLVEDAYLSTPQRLDEAKQLAKEARREIQLAEGKILHDVEEVGKDIGKVGKRLAQLEAKIAVYESFGGDPKEYRLMFDMYTAEYNELLQVIKTGGEGVAMASTLSDLSVLERKVKRLKSMVESAIYAMGGTDEDFDDDYYSDAEDVRDGIRDLALSDEDDDSLDAIEKVVDIHVNEAKETARRVERVQNRNALARAFFGYRNTDLANLEQAIVTNETRVMAMETLVEKIEDEALRALLRDEIAILEADNAKLRNFLAAASSDAGIVGWLNRLFSR